MTTTRPPQCGTRPGYDAHRRRGEQPCGPCRAANTQRVLDWLGPPVGRDLKPHGTMAAVRRHRRHREPLCRSCGQAEARDSQDRYARRAGEHQEAAA